MTFGITPEGFNRKRLDQLLEELNAEMKSTFGENFNVSPESPDGQVNGVISESNANLWEIAEESYDAFNPSAVTGVTQDNLYQLNGLTRLQATASRAELTLTGTIGTVIPLGSLVSTNDTGAQFSTEEEITLDGGGNGNVFASALSTGPISALSGTLTVIDTPVSGWSQGSGTVTNSSDATIGRNIETDVEFRARRERSVARDAQAIIDAIFAEVNSVPGVNQLTVLENDTKLVDANGLPPNSFQVIVVGGDDQAIGQAIWLKKPAGILSFGSTTVQINDSQGIPRNISLSRPTSVNIFVEVTLTTDSDYPADGDDLVKQAIVDYSNVNFSLGEDVIYSRLYTPINTVPGHQIDDLQISISSPASGTINIPIDPDEVSSFLTSNIVVNS